MGEACTTHGDNEKCIKRLVGKPEEERTEKMDLEELR
jgi:hypothetical protein